MVGVLPGDAGMILPQMMLAVHLLHGGARFLPDRGGVEEAVGRPAHLFGR